MINKIKAWPIGAKIVGGIAGGIVGLFLVLFIIGFIGGFVNGFRNASSQYYSYHGPKIVTLDSDTTSMVDDIMKMSRGDNSSETISDFNEKVVTVDRDVIAIQAYEGNVPSQYSQADSDLDAALGDILNTGDRIEQDINSNDIPSFLDDAKKFGNGRTMLKQAAQEMIDAHNKK